MTDKFIFISKDANWQLYRNEVLSKLASLYKINIDILTTGKIKDYIKDKEGLKYLIFKNYFKDSSKISFFPGAIKYILKQKPDRVFALNNTTQITEYIVFIICKLRGIKFTWWTHGYDHLPLKNKFLRNLRKRYVLYFLSKADSIIVFSPYGKEYLVNNKIDESKIFVAPNTLDTDKLFKLRTSVEKSFNKSSFLNSKFPLINTKESNLIILYTGRLLKNKKVDNAIKILNVLNAKYNTNARMMIVGDGPEKERLIQLVTELKLEDKIYLAGSVYNDIEVSQYFLASDIFLMPGFVGLAIIHAFSFGLPIITEDISIHSPEIHYLIPGKNGFLVKEDDIEAAADLINQIITDVALFENLKQHALRTAHNEANIYNMLQNMFLALC